MRCGIVAIDREGRLVMINDLGLQILETDRAPAPGLPIREALRDQPQLAQVLAESFVMTSLPNRAELDLDLGDGDRKTIGFTLSMIPGDDGEPIGAAVFFKDLTRIEHREVQERLKDRLAALGQMAASLAHEIRNPLASIEVSCSLLKRRLDAVDDDGRELLKKITNEVQRLNRTITSSLEFVRPVSLNLGIADVASVLTEAATVASERCRRPQIELITRFQDCLPAFLMDRAQLRQVFENLVLNGLEAMGQTGKLVVEVAMVPAPSGASIPYLPAEGRDNDPWQKFEHFAVIRVFDSGPGIPEEKRDHIFYPFFTTKKQGSGVGLSMVKKIVDSHRGLIDVDRSPLGGAMFTVRLPMVLEG